MDDRAKRVGHNEAVFRSLNERVDELNRTFATLTERFEIVCECGDARCVERLSIPAESYEALRRDPAQFAILPRHDDPSVESVVEEHGEYAVVRKHPGDPARIAEETDPRG